MSHEVSERGVVGASLAGVLLVIGGVLWCLQGIAGIAHGNSYLAQADYWLGNNPTAWGWTHVIGGLLALFAGFGIFSGAGWARLLGIVLAIVSIVVNFAFIPMAPWWSFTIILIDLWIIHSLFVHRRIPG